jgi:predicted nucleic acid-binding protein
MEGSLLIADASTLLNFLRVRRFDLVQGLGYRVRIVDAVYNEIQSEREQLDDLIDAGTIKTLTLDGHVITGSVARFLALGLGEGESFSFAAALEFDSAIAIDDRRAVKRASSLTVGLPIVTTTSIVVDGIRSSKLTIEEADRLKTEWAEKHSFRIKNLNSFGDLL